MKELNLPPGLRGTSLEGPLFALHAIYAKAQEDIDRFCAASGLGCIPGCGECCKGFEPDIRPTEALYMAVWLLGPGRDKIGMLEHDDGSGTCPFFSCDDPHHCQIYPARFLICRLFGFCAMRDKGGAPEYSLCFALSGSGRFSAKRWSGAELEAAFPAAPPVMSDYGSQAAVLAPDSAGAPEPVRAAVAAALGKVSLILSMSQAGIAAGEA